MGGWDKKAIQEYQKKLRLNKEQYIEFLETAKRLFDAGSLDVDSRFLRFQDARDFYERFCRAVSCCVISVSTTREYYEILAGERKSGNSHGRMNGEDDRSSCLGNDILGWDISRFHSFLCNSLQKELPDIKFNRMGLLDHDFTEVTCFADQIKGKGKPVEWIPCRIGVSE